MKTKILLILGISLLIIIVLKLLFKFLIPDDGGFFINLITEIIGAAITFIAIDNIINSNENRVKNEYKKIAYRSLYNPLKNYVFMWLHIGYNSEDESKKELTKMPLNELFLSDSFLEGIKKRDFDDYYNNMIYYGYQDDRLLKEVVSKSYKEFKERINISIDKYAIHYEPQILNLLEHFSEKSHLYEIFDLMIKLEDKKHLKWFHPEALKKEYLNQHFTKLFILIEEYNSTVEDCDLINSDTFLSFKKLDDNVEY